MSRSKKERKQRKSIQLRNKKLTKQYPWLLPTHWNGKVPEDYDWSYIEWGCADGWDKAFGDMFLTELGEKVKELGIEQQFQILEIKEKYGGWRMYCSPCPEEIAQIIEKYEELSKRVCIMCGKPDVPILIYGWVQPICFECWKKTFQSKLPDYSEEELYLEYERLTDHDEPRMPDSYTVGVWKDGEEDERTYDISDTAEKIRVRYQKMQAKRKHQKE